MATLGQVGVGNRDNLHGLVLLAQVDSNQLASLRLKLAKFPALAQSLDERFSESLLSVTAALGARALRLLNEASAPQTISPFPVSEHVESTLTIEPVDIAFVIRSDRYDSCFFAGRVLTEWFAGEVQLTHSFTVFHYLDNRNLYGFKCWHDKVIGQARQRLLRLDDSAHPSWHHGSFLVIQHNLIDEKRWQQIRPDVQERLMGQTKLEGTMLDVDVASHCSKTRAELGTSLLWHQLPVASMGRQGHVELLWSRNMSALSKWLSTRIDEDEDGFNDPLLEFEDNQLTAAFFVPPLAWFAALKL